jgi:hypothetical protein
MKSSKSFLVTKSIVAGALVVVGFAGAAFAQLSPLPLPINLPNTPDDGMRCLSAPNAYTGSLSGNTFFCKRTKIVAQALTCGNPRFPNKVVRVDNLAENISTRGKDVCLAPGRSVNSNDTMAGFTLNQDFVFVAAGTTQVSTIVANQRQQEATAMSLQLTDVDARSLSSTVDVNGGTGGEDRLNVTIEFATFPKPVGLLH